MNIRRLFRRAPSERELDKELRFHIESQVEDNRRAGMTPAEARRQAMLQFGGPAQIREECREIRSLHWLESFWSDLRYAFRTLRASPAFTAAAVLSLALGIGANAAIFTLLHAALWKPLPVPSPGQLFHLMRSDGATDGWSYSWPLYQELRETAEPYGRLLARSSVGPRKLAGDGGAPERIVGETVSGNYFRTLEVRAIAGRLIEERDDQPSAEAVIVLSQALWARRFHAHPAVVGRIVEYDERPFRIAGVAQAGFRGIDAGSASDAWTPIMAVDRGLMANGAQSSWLDLLLRLRPEVAPGPARAALEARFKRHVADELRPDAGPHFLAILQAQHVWLRPAASGFARDGRAYEKPLLALFGVVGLVLLISCGNVANLLLARNLARRQEIAVRAALGAGRGRLAAQLFTETLLVALAGAAAGIGLGVWGCGLLLKLMPPSRVPLAFDLRPDATVLGFTAALAVAAALLCGIGPVWRSWRWGTEGLRQDGHRVTGRSVVGRMLVAGQLALSLTLVAGAGLFLKTLHHLASADLGFRPERIVAFDISYPRNATERHRAQVERELLERIQAHDGLTATCSAPGVYESGGWSNGIVQVDGVRTSANRDNEAQALAVCPGFFETLGVGVLAGRTIGAHDDAGAPRVMVVNETFARKYFPGGNAVGHRITMAEQKAAAREIAGVIRDVRHMGVKEKAWPAIYVPALQRSGLEGTVLVRSNLREREVAELARAELRQADPAAQIERVSTMAAVINAMIARERLVAFLSAAFGGLAALLAAIGLYGVMAYHMTRRTSEIGIRMALGARPVDIRRLALTESAYLIGAGAALGVPGALAAGRSVRSLLNGMSANDPQVLGAATLLMIAIGLLAGWVPAARAARTDPNTALRRG